MKTTGLYIASVTSLGEGKYRLNDCWIQSNFSELRINDAVTDKNGNIFIVYNYQNYPQLAQENLFIDVEWPDYPTTNTAPADNSDTQNYHSTVGSLVKSDFQPDVSYLCRIASAAASYPAYHYSLVLTDARASEPGATLGAVGDYIIDKTGHIFEIVEWNGWEQPLRVKDIKERPHATDGSSFPRQYEYAYLYRPTADGRTLTQGKLSDLGQDAITQAINYANTENWRSRGVAITQEDLQLTNITKITIGGGLTVSDGGAGWSGGRAINLSSTLNLESAFTTSQRLIFTATSGQTIFPVAYSVGFVDVYMNGFKLVRGVDFFANNGTTVVLAAGAIADDIIETISYDVFTIADHYTKGEVDSHFVATVGSTTIDGELTAHAFNLTSSSVFKENIFDFNSDALQLIKDISIKVFNYKSDKKKSPKVGFIAEDTHEIFSGLGQENFDVGNTIGVLVKAVQVLSKRVEELEGR